MKRFMFIFSLLLVFVTITGFCQEGSAITPAQKSEIEGIVSNAVKNELQTVMNDLQNVNAELQAINYELQNLKSSQQPPNTGISSNARAPATSRNALMELGQSKQEDIVSYICSKNPAMYRWYIEEVVKTYIIEAQTEQINHDIAIAQMCYATDFLRIQQRLAAYNYSGMLIDRSFPNMLTGIRAHIQHLKGYASVERLKNPKVDPRYDILVANKLLGTVTTLEDLCRKWAPQSGDYGDRINEILYEMNRFAVYRRL